MTALDAPFADHHRALAEFKEAVRAVPEASWAVPRKPGAWTPAEIAEHIALTYEALGGELAQERQPMRIRTHPLVRRILRYAFLGRIFKTRRLPRKVRAPRELRPTGTAPDAAGALRRLDACARDFEAAARHAEARGRNHITHHIFGAIELPRGVEFCTIHMEHHRRQLLGEG